MLCRYDVVVPAELEGGAPKCACVAGRRPAGRVQPRTHAGRETPGPDAGCLYAVKTISKQVTGASLAEFDFETTYKSDYTPKSRKPRTPAFVGIRWQHKHDFEVPNQYETTYKRDYIEKTPSWKERRPYRPMDWEKKPFVGQTQYQRDYVKKVLDATDHTAPEPELLRKWRPSSAPVPRRKESISKTDFVGYVVRPLEMPNKTYAAIVPKGPAWLPTEYNHEYVGRSQIPPPRLEPKPVWQGGDAPPYPGMTEYTREFHEHPLRGARQIHVDPYDHSIDEIFP